jgi:hypothetical protein
MSEKQNRPETLVDDIVQLQSLWHLIYVRRALVLGFALAGLTIGLLAAALLQLRAVPATSLRVLLGPPGFRAGVFTSGRGVDPADLRQPALIAQALHAIGIEDEATRNRIRAALAITAFHSPAQIKKRELTRISGETPPPLVEDEFLLTLALPARDPVSTAQREQFLRALVDALSESLRQTFATLPVETNGPVQNLSTVRYEDYEMAIYHGMQPLYTLLDRLGSAAAGRAESWASDAVSLRTELEALSNLEVTELRLLADSAISTAARESKLRILYSQRKDLDRTARRIHAEVDVYEQTLTRSLGRARQIPASRDIGFPQPLFADAALIQGAIATDLNNYLLRRILEARLQMARNTTDRDWLEERIRNLENAPAVTPEREATIAAARERFTTAYKKLLTKLQTTLAEFSDVAARESVQISLPAQTEPIHPGLLKGAALGFAVGLLTGLAVSFLRIGHGNRAT